MATNIFSKEGWAQFRENLKNKFRLVIMNKDSFVQHFYSFLKVSLVIVLLKLIVN